MVRFFSSIVPAKGIIVGLCFACVSVVIAQLLPPFTAKSMVKKSWRECCLSSQKLFRMLTKEFVKETSHDAFRIARLKTTAKFRSTLPSIPRSVSSTRSLSFDKAKKKGLFQVTKRTFIISSRMRVVMRFILLLNWKRWMLFQ